MIPQDQLKYLKPLPDMVKRDALIKKRGSKPYLRTRLTKRARQWALWIARIGVTIKEPQGVRSYGLQKMKDRKKKK